MKIFKLIQKNDLFSLIAAEDAESALVYYKECIDMDLREVVEIPKFKWILISFSYPKNNYSLMDHLELITHLPCFVGEGSQSDLYPL